mgnify:CR=1 FL=1
MTLPAPQKVSGDDLVDAIYDIRERLHAYQETTNTEIKELKENAGKATKNSLSAYNMAKSAEKEIKKAPTRKTIVIAFIVTIITIILAGAGGYLVGYSHGNNDYNKIIDEIMN